MGTDYADDCIHLHACRRLSKIVKEQTGKFVKRGCSTECSAYCPEFDNEDEEERMYTKDEVYRCIRKAAEDGRNGYDGYDLLIEDYI